MSNTNTVTFTLENTVENFPKICAIAGIISGELKGDSQTNLVPKQEANNAQVNEPVATETKQETETDYMSCDDFKAAVKEAKEIHGEEFCKEVLAANDCKLNSSLGRSLSGIPESKYSAIVSMMNDGPADQLSQEADDLEEEPVTEAASDMPEDDLSELDDLLDNDDLEGEDIDIDSVKDTLRAYAKEAGKDKARAIMVANGAKALSDLDTCSVEQLSKIMNACNSL